MHFGKRESERRMTDYSQPLFIEYEDVAALTRLVPDAVVSGVRYRTRPRDTTCQHPLVDFGRPERRDGHTMVSCVCLGCGLAWASCRVLEGER